MGGTLSRLDAAIASRVHNPTCGYTSRLLRDRSARLRKLGEESAGLLLALTSESDESVVTEAADVLYVVAVALRARGIPLSEVVAELRRRES